MPNILKNLSPTLQEDLNRAIQKIVSETGAERIYCYGFRSTQRTEWSPFHTSPATDENISVYYYDLLLVMPGTNTSYQDKIDSITHRPISPHTSFVYRTYTSPGFTNLLKNGHPFINKVYTEGILLHYSSQQPILQYNIPDINAAYMNNTTANWHMSITRAHAIHRLAERAAAKNERRQALQHLEVAACQVCTALITLYTAHPQDNDMLRLLLQYCDNFCGIKNRVFPCNTPQEAELLQWLERAVLTKSTNNECQPPAYITDTLLRRIHKLLELADWLYTQKTNQITIKPSSHAN
jgi:hypothetical protein